MCVKLVLAGSLSNGVNWSERLQAAMVSSQFLCQNVERLLWVVVVIHSVRVMIRRTIVGSVISPRVKVMRKPCLPPQNCQLSLCIEARVAATGINADAFATQETYGASSTCSTVTVPRQETWMVRLSAVIGDIRHIGRVKLDKISQILLLHRIILHLNNLF